MIGKYNSSISKTDISNSIENKIKKGIKSEYLKTDYFPEWIVDEMKKLDNK